MRFTLIIYFTFILSISLGQSISTPATLKIDTSYAYFQFHNSQLGKTFLRHFDQIQDDKVVFVHFGGSHIQA